MAHLSPLRSGAKALALAVIGSGCIGAQFKVANRPVEVHGFFSQGLAKSNNSNYLTMQTSRGAFDFTDGGITISTRVTDKFRIGAQGYARNIGHLGNGHVTLDWASADYRFTDYFGVRAGQVKTVLGLYNDTQDIESLHTWALLPQSLYPLDLRGLSLSHLGVDVYGSISHRRIGTFSYTAYIGRMPPDRSGGRAYSYGSYGLRLDSNRGQLRGVDLKWNTPLHGLLFGASLLDSPQKLDATNLVLNGPLFSDSQARNVVLSAQFNRGPWKLDYEHGRALSKSALTGAHGLGATTVVLPYDQRAQYAALAFRVSSHLELGSYHSRFYPNADRQPAFLPSAPAAARHLYDQAFTARVDFKTHWDLKVEGHIIDGYGDPGSSRGFYLQDNPNGLNPQTKLLVVRLGFNY